MAQTVPNTVPAEITAGDSVQWKITLSDYPANAGWVLHYRLINAAAKLDINASTSGSDHLINVLPAASAAYAAGKYKYQAYVDGVNSERHTVAEGNITIAPNLAAEAGGYDTRSSAQKCLDDLNTALQSYGSKAYTQEYAIGDRTMKFNSPGDFMAFRSKVMQEVARENAAAKIKRGEPTGNKLLVRY